MPSIRHDRYEINHTLVAGAERPSAHLPRPKTLSRHRHFHPISRVNPKNPVGRIFSSTRSELICSTRCRRWPRANRGIPVKIIRAAHRIAEAVHPEKVILFGSYAYAHPTADSDVDFLIVHPARTRSQRMNIAIMASTALEPRPFPVDILVRSAQKVEQRVKMGDGFFQEICERGQVVYERSFS